MLSWRLGEKINYFYLFKERCRELRGLGTLNGLDNDYSVYGTYDYFKDLMSREQFKYCLHINQNRCKKRKRCADNYFIIETIARLTNAKMVFGTITLNDDFLKLPYDNQKKNLQYYLKKHFFYVVKNADYGSKTERLHYHFIGLTYDNLLKVNVRSKTGRIMYNIENDKWNWGHIPNYEIIPYDMKNKKRLSNYIVKLNNHSNKLSVHNTKLSVLKNKKYLSKYCVFADCIL